MSQKLNSLELITIALMEQKKAHRKEYLNRRSSRNKGNADTPNSDKQNNTKKMEDFTNE